MTKKTWKSRIKAACKGVGTYKPENWRVMVFNGTRLYAWHAHHLIPQNEKTTLCWHYTTN